jgi:hypothetical protein
MTTPRSILRRLSSSLLLAVCACLTVSCLLLSDRPEFYRCKSQSDCIAGEEVCTASAFSSYGAVGNCEPIGYCQNDNQCDEIGPERCIDERCTPVQCTVYEDDACNQYRCGPGDACLTNCASDSDCQYFESHAYYCLAGACQRDPCNAGLCGGFACTNHVCNTYCAALAGCENGYTCVDTVCQPL